MPLILKTAIPIFTICLILVMAYSTDDLLDCSDFHCWDGIVVGETTYNEALKRIEIRHGWRNVSVEGIRHQVGTIRYHENNPLSDGIIRPDQHGTIFELYIGFQDSNLQVADVISYIGEPTAVFTKGFNQCDTALYYQEIGLMIWLDAQLNTTVVGADQSIEILHMIRPDINAERVISGETVTEWDGYQDYCKFHDPYSALNIG